MDNELYFLAQYPLIFLQFLLRYFQLFILHLQKFLQLFILLFELFHLRHLFLVLADEVAVLFLQALYSLIFLLDLSLYFNYFCLQQPCLLLGCIYLQSTFNSHSILNKQRFEIVYFLVSIGERHIQLIRLLIQKINIFEPNLQLISYLICSKQK